MDPQPASTLPQISDLIKAVGLVSGGIWTAWTFQKLQKTRAAEVANSKTLAEIQKSHLEQQEVRSRILRQQPQLRIELKAADVKCEPVNFLNVTAIMTNEGDQNVQVDFGPSTLIVGMISFGQNGHQSITALQRFAPIYFVDGNDEPQLLDTRVFRVNQKRQFSFAIPFTKPGPYFIQFYATYARVPFDGEKARRSESVQPVAAVEQTIYFAGASQQAKTAEPVTVVDNGD